MSLVVHLFGRALREIGFALDRQALRFSVHEIFQDTFTRHRPIMPMWQKYASISSGVFVAPSAAIVGAVTIKSKSSIWYGAMIRADSSSVTIGESSNIQDHSIIVTNVRKSDFSNEVNIGDHVTVGHGAMLTSCTIGNNVLIGQGSIIQEGVTVGSNVMIAAGTILLPGVEVPNGQLWGGNPGVFMRDLTPEDLISLKQSATKYSDLASTHAKDVQSATLL